jgi:cytochrome c-type biogenesis protein CcmH/NrfF
MSHASSILDIPPRLRVGLLVALAAFVLQMGPAFGQSSRGGGAARTPGEVSNIVEELSQELYSPYCPGKTIAMCPSGGAAELRREIQRLAREGKSKAEIKQVILDEHGEKYRIETPPEEDHYPLIGIIVAGLLVCIAAVYLLSRDPDEDESVPAEDEDWDEEDEAYLEALRREYTD